MQFTSTAVSYDIPQIPSHSITLEKWSDDIFETTNTGTHQHIYYFTITNHTSSTVTIISIKDTITINTTDQAQQTFAGVPTIVPGDTSITFKYKVDITGQLVTNDTIKNTAVIVTSINSYTAEYTTTVLAGMSSSCWTESCQSYPLNITTATEYSKWTPKGSTSDIDAIISPVGNGSLSMYQAVAGKSRGINAIDLRASTATGNVGNYSLATGTNNTYPGNGGLVIGSGNTGILNNNNSILSGSNNKLTGIGSNNIIGGNNVTITGSNNLAIGNNVGNTSTTTGDNNIISGVNNRVTGSNNIIVRKSGTANTFTIGDGNIVGGESNNSVYGKNSIVTGDTYTHGTSGGPRNYCITVGNNITNTVSDGIFAFGYGGTAVNASNTFGLFGSNYIQGKGSIQIMGGNSPSDRPNIMMGTSNIGEGCIIANRHITGNADYAEFFHLESNKPGDSTSGYPSEDDYVGYFATYNIGTENVMKHNSKSDVVMGVFVSSGGTSCIQGDAAPLVWANKYITDDYGRRIVRDSYIPSLLDLYPSTIPNVPLDPNKTNGELMDGQDLLKYLSNVLKPEEIKLLELRSVPTVNPGYDPNLEYKSRDVRNDWALVSLLGKVYVRQNGKVTAGTYCKCVNGIAVPGGTPSTGW